MKRRWVLELACFVCAASMLSSAMSYAAQAVTVDNTTANPVPVSQQGQFQLEMSLPWRVPLHKNRRFMPGL